MGVLAAHTPDGNPCVCRSRLPCWCRAASEAAATLHLFNNFAAPAGFETQTKIAGAIIAANSALSGGVAHKAQAAALESLKKSLGAGLEAAEDLKVRVGVRLVILPPSPCLSALRVAFVLHSCVHVGEHVVALLARTPFRACP